MYKITFLCFYVALCISILKKDFLQGFIMEIAEVGNKSSNSSFTFKETTNISNSYVIGKLFRGATYRIRMKTNVLSGRWTKFMDVKIGKYLC